MRNGECFSVPSLSPCLCLLVTTPVPRREPPRTGQRIYMRENQMTASECKSAQDLQRSNSTDYPKGEEIKKLVRTESLRVRYLRRYIWS